MQTNCIMGNVEWRILFPLTKHQNSYSLLSWLLEETGNEKRQTSIIETTVLGGAVLYAAQSFVFFWQIATE